MVEPGREAVDPLFGRNANHVPEKVLSLPAGLGISDHKDDGDAKAAREEGVHFELAHELPVQTEGVDVLAEEGMGENAPGAHAGPVVGQQKRGVKGGVDAAHVEVGLDVALDVLDAAGQHVRQEVIHAGMSLVDKNLRGPRFEGSLGKGLDVAHPQRPPPFEGRPAIGHDETRRGDSGGSLEIGLDIDFHRLALLSGPVASLPALRFPRQADPRSSGRGVPDAMRPRAPLETFSRPWNPSKRANREVTSHSSRQLTQNSVTLSFFRRKVKDFLEGIFWKSFVGAGEKEEGGSPRLKGISFRERRKTEGCRRCRRVGKSARGRRGIALPPGLDSISPGPWPGSPRPSPRRECGLLRRFRPSG